MTRLFYVYFFRKKIFAGFSENAANFAYRLAGVEQRPPSFRKENEKLEKILALAPQRKRALRNFLVCFLINFLSALEGGRFGVDLKVTRTATRVSLIAKAFVTFRRVA